ncbi:hypothetical protein QQF64_018403 [Cirrhinus molitorella]|uniref:Uncharacterized protein n=1 Tax=Cirrhinus molitorella TaxID=172907 RepID=A0ABR3LCH1_9TELE
MSMKLRRVCVRSMRRLRKKRGQKVGGLNICVHIDESKFRHRRKYARGRFGGAWRRKSWVFGMVEILPSRKPVLRLVDKRDKTTLLPIIEKHVKRGSIIHSDEWRAYSTLSERGYQHHTVNHSIHFVNPSTGVHTQNIERAWANFKREVWRMRANRHSHSITDSDCVLKAAELLLSLLYNKEQLHTMFVLGLLTCVMLRAFTAQAKVSSSFEECNEFFYKGIEPKGLDQNAKKICQGPETSNRNYYASLYSDKYKIPLYSAYTLDRGCTSNSGAKIVVPDNFTSTMYDQGQLNPSSFQCGDGRTATYTKTNIAPLDACFKSVHWSKWESTLRAYLLKQLVMDDNAASVFIVTGTVPDPSVQIPDLRNVTVPSHIWTAVCYKHTNDDRKSFSFSYLGQNLPVDPGVSLMSISDLNIKLRGLYSKLPGTNQPNIYISKTHLARLVRMRSKYSSNTDFQAFSVFNDDCSGNINKLNKVIEEFKKLENLLVHQAVQMSSGTQDTSSLVIRKVSSDDIPILNNNNDVSKLKVKLVFDSMSTYYDVAEDLKVVVGSVCPITYAKSDTVECLLVPIDEGTTVDGLRCSSVSESDYKCTCMIEGKRKLCCSTPCLYQDDVNGYRCYSEQKLVQCSPSYSLITAYGEKCLEGSPCAKYDKDYYWCKTASSWDYCSPPLWSSRTTKGQPCRSNHACAYYGSNSKWCYTDESNHWDYC